MCLIIFGLAGCLSPPASSDGPVDGSAAGNDDAAVGSSDGSVNCEILFADDFEGQTVELERWNQPYIEPDASISVSGGQLRMVAGTLVSDEGGYAELNSRSGFDSALTVFQMSAVPVTSTGSEVSLTFYDVEANKHVGLQIGYGQTSVVLDDVPQCSDDCPDLVTGPQMFRVTDDGESIRFEIEAGDGTWTLLGQTEAVTSSMTAVDLSAYADSGESSEWSIEELSWMQCL